MPTKKDIFLLIRNKLKTNIPSLNNNVFPAYPLKEPVFPFVVLDIKGKDVVDYNISNNPLSFTLDVTITVYASTKEKTDEISEQIENLLYNEDIFGAIKEVSCLSSFQEINDLTVVYETPIKLTLLW